MIRQWPMHKQPSGESAHALVAADTSPNRKGLYFEPGEKEQCADTTSSVQTYKTYFATEH